MSTNPDFEIQHIGFFSTGSRFGAWVVVWPETGLRQIDWRFTRKGAERAARAAQRRLDKHRR